MIEEVEGIVHKAVPVQEIHQVNNQAYRLLWRDLIH